MNRRAALALGGAALVAAGIAMMDQTWLRAQLGGADSQLKLAYAYGTGQGVELDQRKAAQWYLRAAQQGDARGQLAIAARYDEGLGVTRDPVEAAKWYRKAAEQGVSEAQLAMAFRHRDGRGVERDRVQAAMWLILADRYVASRSDALQLLEELKKALSETELTEARRLAADWRTAHPAPGG